MFRKYLYFIFAHFFFLACGSGEIIESIEVKDAPSKIMIVPDIQNYTDSEQRLKYLDSIANYYIDNYKDFAACLQVGDLTNHNKRTEYENAYSHLIGRYPLSKEVYFCLGNHDYGVDGTSDVRESNLPDYMKPVVDFQMTGCKYENYVKFLRIGTKEYAIMDLEFAPRNEAILWANQVVSQFDTIPFIILTHVFTNKYGQIHDSKDDSIYHSGSQKEYFLGERDYINDSMEIFTKLITPNPNIVMVICGHTFISDYIKVGSKKNTYGSDVYYITVNYQHADEGGNGNVAILDFGEESYRIRSYCTVNNTIGDVDITFGF